MDFIWYYPRTTGVSICLEAFNQADYYNLWVSMNNTGEILFDITPDFYMLPMNFTLDSVNKFQNIFNNARYGSCSSNTVYAFS